MIVTQNRPPVTNNENTNVVDDTPAGGHVLSAAQQQALRDGYITPNWKKPAAASKPPAPTPWGGTREGSDGAGSWVGLSQKPVYPRNTTPQPATGTIWGQKPSFNQRAHEAANVQNAKGFMNNAGYANPQFKPFFDRLQAANTTPQPVNFPSGNYEPAQYIGAPATYNSAATK